jgi:hypothetical protein
MQPEPAGPDHNDRLTRREPSDVGQRVEGSDDRVRADGGLWERNIVGNGGQVPRRNRDVLGQSSLRVDADDAAVQADLAVAGQAGGAGSVEGQREHAHRLVH